MKDEDTIRQVFESRGSTRTANCFIWDHWPETTIGELKRIVLEEPARLFKIRNFGKGTFNEVCRILGLPERQIKAENRLGAPIYQCPHCNQPIEIRHQLRKVL